MTRDGVRVGGDEVGRVKGNEEGGGGVVLREGWRMEGGGMRDEGWREWRDEGVEG